MQVSRMTEKGQITIPKRIARQYGPASWRPGGIQSHQKRARGAKASEARAVCPIQRVPWPPQGENI